MVGKRAYLTIQRGKVLRHIRLLERSGC
jgi:hypothetical protein